MGSIARVARFFWSRIQGEPVIVMWVFSSGLSVAMAFGLQWSAEQVVVVNGFATALLSFIVRRRVEPGSPV